MKDPIKLLELPDSRLFFEGACHVFARALSDLYSDYEIRCIDFVDPEEPTRGNFCSHVYCLFKDQKIDFSGVEDESSFILSEVEKSRDGHFPNFRPVVRFPSVEELFEPLVPVAFPYEDGFERSERYLIVDRRFMAPAELRAKRHIAAHLEKYSIQ